MEERVRESPIDDEKCMERLVTSFFSFFFSMDVVWAAACFVQLFLALF